MNRIAALSLCGLVSAIAHPVSAAPSFVEIAREFSDGLMWVNSEVRPALASDGTVVFAGNADSDPSVAPRIFAGSGSALYAIDVEAAGLSDLGSLQIDDAGHIAFVAERNGVSPGLRGAYAADLSGTPIGTLYEGVQFPIDDDPTPVTGNIALSRNGTLAFSTVLSASGALYRGPIDGTVAVLRTSTGIFYNSQQLDVNDAGQVAVQMEYGDPTAGLRRGILLFDAPEQSLGEIDTAVERLSIGMHPQPSINAGGQVAFALANTITLLFFDPPGVFSATPVAEITLDPGVYVANPTPFGVPSDVTLLADTTGDYASFAQVAINAAGLVVFEATLDSGEFGVFSGPDPLADKIVATGDTLGEVLFSVVRMGELNDAGELSLLTSDVHSGDRQVWRVSGFDLAEPPDEEPPPSTWHEVLRTLLCKLFGSDWK